MRLAEVFRYELGYRLRSVSTWVYAVFLFLLAFWIVHVAATGFNPVFVNAPQQVAQTMSLFCGLFGILVTAGLCSDAVIRDRTAAMDALLFTTRLRPDEYLRGRFLAAIAINAMLLLAVPAGFAVATLMPYLPREAFGPNRVIAYAQPFVLFLLPNLVLMGAILFTIAALTRKAIPVYLGAIGIFIGYIVAANYWSSITNPFLSVLADPFGINTLKGLTEYWPAAERNTRLVGFPAKLLWNRVLWAAIAAGLLFVLERTFRFVQRDERVRDRKRADAPGEERWTGVMPHVTGVFGPRTRVRQTLAITRQSLAETMSGWSFPVAFAGAIGLVLLWGWNIGESWVDTITWPVTHLVASVVLSERAILIPWLVIVLFAGELVWKERETGTAAIADALPVRSGSALLGRFLALVVVVVTFQIAFMIGGVLLQTLQGYHEYELGLYLQILFGIKLVDYVLLAALAMTIHVLVNHKYVAHVLTLLLIIFNAAALSGVHHLAIYDSGPQWTYSAMNGLGFFAARFILFKLYWAGWALLFAVIAFVFWVRGPELGVRERLIGARSRVDRGVVRLAVVAFALIAGFGAVIFYNTNVLAEHLPPQEAGRPQAEYERLYGRYRNLPQPEIAGAELRFEIRPEQPAIDMSGTYELVNRTAVPIDSIHVESPNGRWYHVRAMTFDGGAKATLVDQDHGYRIFQLARPLAPGESLRFRFDVGYRPRGFPHGSAQTTVVRNGSYFDRRLLPFIGYQPGFELSSESERKRYGLRPQALPSPGEADAGQRQSRFRDGGRIDVETIVGTSADQIAVVPGVLRRTWTENGRRYFHYGTRIPETFGTSVFSARYAVEKGRWNDVALEIFHHPAHRYDLDRMMAGMKAALGYYTTVFGPYPYRELRIIEIPPYSINARAFPSALAMAEQNFITRTEPGTVDLTFFGTAHEIAHQWWGGQVRPAYAKGRSFVGESLANYSAMLVTEKVLGATEARRVYDFQMDRYLRQRAEYGRDVPLLEVDDHPYVSYGKGAVALYTLREQIGEDAVNTALRRFLAKFGRSGPPFATSLDLYAELRAVTPPSHRYLLTDLFETITLWDVKTQRASTRRMPDGRYEVTLDVVAQKVRADGLGVETPTPMNDFVDVAVFGAREGEVLYRTQHRLRSGAQTLRVIVPRKPSRAGLDPDRKLIERERGDDVVDVESSR